MRINHTISAIYAQRQLRITDFNISKSMEKLSSGMRINRAADDSAGLAISEKFREQINGLYQAQKNTQDGISLVQTAEGGLHQIHEMMQRLRELAVQASNDTWTTADREHIQVEVNNLLNEIDRQVSTTEFNTRKLLTGTYSNTRGNGWTQVGTRYENAFGHQYFGSLIFHVGSNHPRARIGPQSRWKSSLPGTPPSKCSGAVWSCCVQPSSVSDSKRLHSRSFRVWGPTTRCASRSLSS